MTAGRQAAEALFRPKAPEPTRLAPTTAPAAPDPAPVLRAVEPARPNPEHIVVAAVAATTPAAPSVPPWDLTQIKTWLKYGMTIAQVAQVYSLAIRDLKRLL
jgi:hypothetical protein